MGRSPAGFRQPGGRELERGRAMKHWAPVLATGLLVVLTASACGGKKPAPVAPPPPVAPATPPPAPPPTTTAPAPVNEYDRLKAMSADEIDRMGLLADVHFE